MQNTAMGKKRKHFETKGWISSTIEQLPGLNKQNVVGISIKLILADNPGKLCLQKKLTQAGLVNLLNSSRPRIAKMEVTDPSVSLNLIIKSVQKTGKTTTQSSSLDKTS